MHPIVPILMLGLNLTGEQTAAPSTGVSAAQAWVGRALILRGFYAGEKLEFDAAGRVEGNPKTTDWTLAGMDLEKVSTAPGGQIVLEGTRVAIQYNVGAHTFDRHPLKNEPLRVTIAAAPDAAGVEREMQEVFSQGIDPDLQRSMPPYWSHYFVPSLDWMGDELKGATILGANGKVPAGLTMPAPEKKPEPDFTPEAQAARLKGAVLLTCVVDLEGIPRRITVRQPLGYGLDARAAEALARYRFKPGVEAGKPVAVELIVNQGFNLAP